MRYRVLPNNLTGVVLGKLPAVCMDQYLRVVVTAYYVPSRTTLYLMKQERLCVKNSYWFTVDIAGLITDYSPGQSLHMPLSMLNMPPCG
ncbi:hypothetical protein MIR68_000447 [Amoeboaphelidium protococcarum]|nr:hypothetical protein MIR68_000447 [Amoeboaphelidium protococcarum]